MWEGEAVHLPQASRQPQKREDAVPPQESGQGPPEEPPQRLLRQVPDQVDVHIDFHIHIDLHVDDDLDDDYPDLDDDDAYVHQ